MGSCACKSTEVDEEVVRNKERTKVEGHEKVEMLKKAEEFIKGRYKIKESMADIGSRLQKYWMEIEETEIEQGQREKKSYILSISKFSSICPLGSREEVSEKMEILSKLLGVLNKHPNVYEIKEVAVERIEKIDADAVIIIQTKNPGGSLRDKISGFEEDEFTNSWSQKRSRTDSTVEFHDVLKTYAIQILEGMLFLKKIGFGYLGNIHLGNIYLIKSASAEEDISANAAEDVSANATEDVSANAAKGVCQISGHENTLFGYRTGIFEEVVRKPEFLQYMDVIMFGRILYGLAKGKQLKDNEVFPSEEQLESIKNRELKKLLKYVFERSNKKMKHSLEDILNKLEGIKWFHRKTSRDFMKGVDETSITEEMKELLSKIKP